MKKVAILGSTGSIGKQAVEIIEKNPDKFKVLALVAHKNISLLAEQTKKLKPKYVGVVDEACCKKFSEFISSTKVKLICGKKALSEPAMLSEVDIVLNAVVGTAGLDATLTCLKLGKLLALANKESMVAGGEIIRKHFSSVMDKIIPVDSEHSAIFQCLLGEEHSFIHKIILTGSGGPFLGRSLKELEKVTVEEALAHPRWKMGKKITIDSSTLMNKGLEVIEAHYLFSMPYDRIEVLIHPQSIIHSLVEFRDGSIKAQLAPTDMRLPLQFALSYPKRFKSPLSPLNLVEIGEFNFYPPDLNNFPCLRYAYEAGKKGETYPAVLNASNEVAVAAFLEGRISFTDIPEIVLKALEAHEPLSAENLENVREAEREARKVAENMIKEIRKKGRN